MQFSQNPREIIVCCKNGRKNAKNSLRWAFTQDFKKTSKNSSIHRGILHVSRPAHLDSIDYPSDSIDLGPESHEFYGNRWPHIRGLKIYKIHKNQPK